MRFDRGNTKDRTGESDVHAFQTGAAWQNWGHIQNRGRRNLKEWHSAPDRRAFAEMFDIVDRMDRSRADRTGASPLVA